MRQLVNLIGKRFERLIVLSRTEDNKFGHVMWKCKCDCGRDAIVSSGNLKRGITRSCGCLQIEGVVKRSFKHGMKNSHEYWSYSAAKGRCQNPKNHAYGNYGGRGIEFKFNSFKEFLGEVGMKPSPEHTLDRIDNDGHYEVGNLRWSLPQEQIDNRRIKRIENFSEEEFALEAQKRGYIKIKLEVA